MPGSNMWEMERRYSVAENDSRGLGLPPPSLGMLPSTSEDLHAWSIYRQNLNSDFTDSALGSSEKSPLPYGNFQLRESTVQSILNHPRYGPKSALGSNMYTYLKFGLPRVFPPHSRAGKETSSGYNSSDEGTRTRPGTYLRARSEADILNLHYQPGISARGKSISQANLLSPDTLIRQAQASHRRSLHDLRHTDYMHHNLVQPPLTRPASVAMANHHHHAPSIISGHPIEPFSFSMLHPQQYTGLYPHLQIRNMNVRTKRGEPLVNNLSMEVKAGEILSIMSTNGGVATALLEVITGNHEYSGHISLNGQAVTSADLRRIVAYVRSDTVLHPDLPVHNCLCFYSKLRHPHKSRGKIPMEEQVRMVTEELGLSPVLETKIGELTRSEYSRLLVAVQLLSDAQILCIDQITHTMDIFDTFFLVEFLRQWASGATGGVTGRIVVMSLQPPTYEILTMVSRLLVLSSGETMYHGPARHITQYFTSAEYPCPAYKNPADYYLDLVTLDDLSAEAMLESSQRVDQLASLYRRRQQPLSEAQPYSLPTKFSMAGSIGQAYALFMKEAVYSQPSSFAKWISRVLLSAFMSILVGAIFWDIPASDPQLYREDRLGFHYTMMVVAAWPLLLVLSFSKTHGIQRDAAESDICQNLYYRPVYVICSLVFTLIPSALIWVAYLLPAYCMTGLYDQSTADGLTFYLGYNVVHLVALQYLTMAVGYLAPGGRGPAALVASLVYTVMGCSTGYPIHKADIPRALAALGLATPAPWLYTPLVSREMSKDTLVQLNSHLVCRNKQVQHQDIIVQLPCPVANGSAAMLYHGLVLPSSAKFQNPLVSLLDEPPYSPVLPPLLIALAAALLAVFGFVVSPLFRTFERNRRNRNGGR